MSAITALVEGRLLTSQERIEALSWHTQLAQAEATIGELRAEFVATETSLRRTTNDWSRLARILPALEETT